jgi:hypothetical protein
MVTTYINSKGESLLISEMNFVYLQNALAKLRKQLQSGQMIKTHDDRIRMQNVIKAMQAEYEKRPEYIPPDAVLPKFVSKSDRFVSKFDTERINEIEEEGLDDNGFPETDF